MLIFIFRLASVCPADTALAAASRGGGVQGVPRGMWTVCAVAVLFPIRARLVTQVHGFFREFLFAKYFSCILLHTALTPLFPKAVHPPHDLSGVMQCDVTQFTCGGLLCRQQVTGRPPHRDSLSPISGGVISQHTPLKQQASYHADELPILLADAELQGGQHPP